MSVSNIPEKIKIILWGKASGRCQYRGCNACLYTDSLTQAEFNSAYIAHIIADSPEGPRGDSELSEKLEKDISNLMLMCDEHHRLIDKADVSGHTVSLLKEMKKEHEERIAIVSAINPNMHSHIVIYKANVGVHTPEISYESLREFLLPSRYPAINRAIDLSLSNSPMRDRDDIFWNTETNNLEEQYKQQLLPLLRKGEIKHMSVFGFAPQPLLIKLGTLLSEVQNIDVFQRHREPSTWKWQTDSILKDFEFIQPIVKSGIPALVFSLSATVTDDRIKSVIGDDCNIWKISISNPGNDFLKTKELLSKFRAITRHAFDKIKSFYNDKMPLHIFPVMPVSAAIELGRVWMPKADMPLIIYDQNTAVDGFIKSIEIKNQ